MTTLREGLVLEEVEENLYLGNRLAAVRQEHDHRFEYVVTVSRDREPMTTAYYPMRDGQGNDPEAFAEAVKSARYYYRSPGKVLVHCEAGISRSTTVIATVLVAEKQARSFAHAVEQVREVRPDARPADALIDAAEQYLGTTVDRSAIRAAE
ncbi:protein-tyrosine phosphatase family protein [Halobacterium rubrum]|uniref:protein-tyrosine phosphatase family protein n=1 Tax=Halobacterium TaxID=2239 RepID=UPI001F48E5E8|nr:MULTISPECIES: dual specificity protein phosphatase [Halobacterium]MDH5021693.1 dual specificity protein phosphatase [Halobacterium rubrum]